MSLTEAQIEQHKHGIGGSEAASAIGLEGAWRTPLDLWFEKTGQSIQVERETPDYLHFGSVLEDVIAKEYERRTENKVRRRSAAVVCKHHSFMFAHVDRTVDNEALILECKTAGQYMAGQWGDSWTDEFPDTYRIQCMHQMVCMPRSMGCHLAVLIGGSDFRMYEVAYDEELAEVIIAKESIFWQRVVDREPPPPTTLADLALLYPVDSGEVILATRDAEQAVREYANLKMDIKHRTEALKGLRFEIEECLGAGSVLVDGEATPLVTYKKSRDGTKFDAKAFAEENPAVAKEYEVEVPGSRRFLVKVKGGVE